MKHKPDSATRSNFVLLSNHRLDYRRAVQILQAGGLSCSVEHAARIAVDALGRGPRANSANFPIEDVVERFMTSTMRRGKRERTLEFYRVQLEKFAMAFAGRNIADITRAEVKMHVESCASGVAGARWRAVRRLFRWAIGQEPPLAGTDPTAGLLPDLPQSRKEKGFLSVEQCRHLLSHAGEYRHAAALMLFAGLRPGEVGAEGGKESLRWEHIDRAAHSIRVPANVSKTAKDRVIDNAFPVLWEWIKDAPETGPVCTTKRANLVIQLQLAAGFQKRAPNGRRRRTKLWPFDAPRHTFATNHIALYQDAGRTSLAMGHEGKTTLLHTTYNGLTTKAEAEKFAALRPTKT